MRATGITLRQHVGGKRDSSLIEKMKRLLRQSLQYTCRLVQSRRIDWCGWKWLLQATHYSLRRGNCCSTCCWRRAYGTDGPAKLEVMLSQILFTSSLGVERSVCLSSKSSQVTNGTSSSISLLVMAARSGFSTSLSRSFNAIFRSCCAWISSVFTC